MRGWRLRNALVQCGTFAKQAAHRAAVRLRNLAGNVSQLSAVAAARVRHMCTSTGGAIVPLAATSDPAGRGWRSGAHMYPRSTSNFTSHLMSVRRESRPDLVKNDWKGCCASVHAPLETQTKCNYAFVYLVVHFVTPVRIYFPTYHGVTKALH